VGARGTQCQQTWKKHDIMQCSPVGDTSRRLWKSHNVMSHSVPPQPELLLYVQMVTNWAVTERTRKFLNKFHGCQWSYCPLRETFLFCYFVWYFCVSFKNSLRIDFIRRWGDLAWMTINGKPSGRSLGSGVILEKTVRPSTMMVTFWSIICLGAADILDVREVCFSYFGINFESKL